MDDGCLRRYHDHPAPPPAEQTFGPPRTLDVGGGLAVYTKKIILYIGSCDHETPPRLQTSWVLGSSKDVDELDMEEIAC